MLSVENFYWILYENLLKHHDLDAWYYLPAGTMHNLIRHQFQPVTCTKNNHGLNHVLFHYDQEPIWEKDLGHDYDRSYNVTWSQKTCKFLANSEISNLKNELCHERSMLDWYYFYHGFASLDWFKDAQFLSIDHDTKDLFVSFNHLCSDKRAYRMDLVARLIEQGLHRKAKISFHATRAQCRAEIEKPYTNLSAQSCDLVASMTARQIDFPMCLDTARPSGHLSGALGPAEWRLWQNAFFHLVTETVFYDQKLHLTEKIFKPIVAQRPFILVAAPGNLAYLRSYGFHTFGAWINESYDEVQDPDTRLTLIVHEIAKLSRLSEAQIRDMYNDMLPVLEHNKKHFFGAFREKIVNELIDNFSACVNRWNNGRVDGRNLPIYPNLDWVKAVLLRS